MTGYRPLDLVPLGVPAGAGRRDTYADRRRAAAERMSVAADLDSRLAAAVDCPGDGAPSRSRIDPDGVLRAAIRALLPLAYKTEGFDVTVSLGPDHAWSARLIMTSSGLQAHLLPSSPEGGRSSDSPGCPQPGGVASQPFDGSSEAEIAGELAELVWSGGVGPR